MHFGNEMKAAAAQYSLLLNQVRMLQLVTNRKLKGKSKEVDPEEEGVGPWEIRFEACSIDLKLLVLKNSPASQVDADELKKHFIEFLTQVDIITGEYLEGLFNNIVSDVDRISLDVDSGNQELGERYNQTCDSCRYLQKALNPSYRAHETGQDMSVTFEGSWALSFSPDKKDSCLDYFDRLEGKYKAFITSFLHIVKNSIAYKQSVEYIKGTISHHIAQLASERD